MSVIINKKNCTKDLLCIEVCPVSCLMTDDFGFPTFNKETLINCILCGHCSSICPTSSFEHPKIDIYKLQPSTENTISFNDIRKLLISRRSIRNFNNNYVSRKLVEKLINIANYAPSGHNSQPTEWIVITNENRLIKLGQLTIDWMYTVEKDYPEIFDMFSMKQVIESWEKGIDSIFNNAPVLIIAFAHRINHVASITANMALGYIEIGACSLNLGTCWTGCFLNGAIHNDKIKKELSLKKTHIIHGAITLGYPKNKFTKIPPRKTKKIKWL